MYAIRLHERNYLLQELERRFGQERMAEVANVLLSYVQHAAQEKDTLPTDELQAEHWAAMAYIDSTRDQVVNELVSAFWECLIVDSDGSINAVNWAAMRRLLTIVEEVTPQLGNYPELLKFAELTGRILADQWGDETLAMMRADLLAQELFVNGRALPRLEELVNQKRYQSVTAAAIVHHESWKVIDEAFSKTTAVKGQVVGNNDDGLLVDVGGILTFLPTAHIDVRPVSNLSAFRNHDVEALVLEASLEKARVILSRRALILETEKVAFDEALAHLQEGMLVEGTIVKLTEWGAFVNFGGEIDGLMHISEMSWGYVPDPSWLFKVDDRVEALVIKLDRETRSILLSYKQLVPNPWTTVEERYAAGTQVTGTVVSSSDQRLFIELEPHVIGGISLSEFRRAEQETSEQITLPEQGSKIEVWIVDIDTDRHRMTLSLNRSVNEQLIHDVAVSAAWDDLETAYREGSNVKGRVVDRIKGGLRVDIDGITAFLPGSQVDVRPVRNLDGLRDQIIEAKIIKLNRKRSNVVLSRKAVIEHENSGRKNQILERLKEDIIVEGQIKNLTDYGAFVDLGGVDGLLHLHDMSWSRLQNPNELFKVGDTVRVKVLKFDRERERVSLGYKQLAPDPWSSVEEHFPVGTRITRRVASVLDYGAFIELEPGVEGLVHVSDMSWSKRVKHPSKVVNPGDMVEVEVLGVDQMARRIRLGMKQLQENPWQTLHERYQVGMRVHGRVRNLTDFGAFIEIEDGIDGLVHISDMSWPHMPKHPKEVLKKGQEIEAVITSIDIENHRLALSIKDLTSWLAWEKFTTNYKAGDIIRGKVRRFANFGAFVELDDNIEGLCHISELSEEGVAKPQDVVQLGQELDFKILRIDPETRKIGLSATAVGKDEPIDASAKGRSADEESQTDTTSPTEAKTDID